MAALKQFIEVDTHKAIGLRQAAGSASCRGWAQNSTLLTSKMPKSRLVRMSLPLWTGERRGQKLFVDTIDRNKCGPAVVESDGAAFVPNAV